MDTVSKLSRYAAGINSPIRVIGIPKTIDNDLVMTDHTPGFGSAAKYVASMVREIVLDATVYQQKSVTIVELMGRHAGWLTAASVLARKHENDNPLLIYLPESAFSLEQFFQGSGAGLPEEYKRGCLRLRGTFRRLRPLYLRVHRRGPGRHLRPQDADRLRKDS